MEKQELFSLQHEGICAYNRKQYLLSLEIFQKYQSHLPNDPMAYYNLCMVFEELKRWDDAKIAIEKAISLDPSTSYFYHHLAFVFASQGDFDSAKNYFLKAVSIDPEYINAHYNLGVMYELLDQKSNAIAEFQLCIQLDSEYIFAHNHLSVLYMDMDQWEEAKREIDISLSLCAEDPIIHGTLSIFYARQEQYDKALDAIQKSIELCPDNITYTFNKADILFQMQRYSEAKEIGLDLIKKDPQFSPAYVLLGNYYLYFKNETIAEKYFHQAISLTPSLKNTNEDIKHFFSKILLKDSQASPLYDPEEVVNGQN
jgi:tetratricopeptide (TPR) repeat protein